MTSTALVEVANHDVTSPDARAIFRDAPHACLGKCLRKVRDAARCVPSLSTTISLKSSPSLTRRRCGAIIILPPVNFELLNERKVDRLACLEVPIVERERERTRRASVASFLHTTPRP